MKIDEEGKVEENEEGKEVMDVVRAPIITKLMCKAHGLI